MFAPNYIENKLKFFPHIKEAVAFGDGRDKVCAFINIDIERRGQLGRAAQPALCRLHRPGQKPEVYELIKRVRRAGQCATWRTTRCWPAQISRFLVLHKELDADDGELTRTRKVRRGFIAEKYGVLIDALYGGKTEQFIETEVKFEDGRTGKVSADAEDLDAKTFPVPPEKAA
jgi:long-chain acyl-CoA synthetase